MSDVLQQGLVPHLTQALLAGLPSLGVPGTPACLAASQHAGR